MEYRVITSVTVVTASITRKVTLISWYYEYQDHRVVESHDYFTVDTRSSDCLTQNLEQKEQ